MEYNQNWVENTYPKSYGENHLKNFPIPSSPTQNILNEQNPCFNNVLPRFLMPPMDSLWNSSLVKLLSHSIWPYIEGDMLVSIFGNSAEF